MWKVNSGKRSEIFYASPTLRPQRNISKNPNPQTNKPQIPSAESKNGARKYGASTISFILFAIISNFSSLVGEKDEKRRNVEWKSGWHKKELRGIRWGQSTMFKLRGEMLCLKLLIWWWWEGFEGHPRVSASHKLVASRILRGADDEAGVISSQFHQIPLLWTEPSYRCIWGGSPSTDSYIGTYWTGGSWWLVPTISKICPWTVKREEQLCLHRLRSWCFLWGAMSVNTQQVWCAEKLKGGQMQQLLV